MGLQEAHTMDELVSIVPDPRKHHLNNLQLEYSLRTQPVSWTSLLNEGKQFVLKYGRHFDMAAKRLMTLLQKD